VRPFERSKRTLQERGQQALEAHCAGPHDELPMAVPLGWGRQLALDVVDAVLWDAGRGVHVVDMIVRGPATAAAASEPTAAAVQPWVPRGAAALGWPAC
jgi:hypothetical protein